MLVSRVYFTCLRVHAAFTAIMRSRFSRVMNSSMLFAVHFELVISSVLLIYAKSPSHFLPFAEFLAYLSRYLKDCCDITRLTPSNVGRAVLSS